MVEPASRLRVHAFCRARVAWKNREGYTFTQEEMGLVENASAKTAIQLAAKLLDK